jgi:hypothetical protein
MDVAKVDQAHANPPAGAASGAVDAASISGAASGTSGAAEGSNEDGTAKRGTPFVARGIYMTATSVELPRFKTMIAELKAAGGNTIVFDAKDEDGVVQYRSKLPEVRQINADHDGPIRDLKAKIDYAHSQGIHVAGRVCCFHDPILAKKRPELAPHDVHGGIWKELGRQAWVDPSLPAAQDYVIAVAKELAASGVDEVQFDYIRFPAMGRTQDARYAYDAKTMEKHDVITAFLKRAYNEIHATGKMVSIDVYGIMAWAQPIDIKITGQKMEEMAKYTDVICPMDYPSHFNDGFAGIAHPANSPYLFVDKALSLLNKRVEGTGVTVRPWLQAMPYKVASFTPHYITEQLRAADKNKAVGYLMWNAQNRYDTAMAGMKAYHKLGK